MVTLTLGKTLVDAWKTVNQVQIESNLYAKVELLLCVLDYMFEYVGRGEYCNVHFMHYEKYTLSYNLDIGMRSLLK